MIIQIIRNTPVLFTFVLDHFILKQILCIEMFYCLYWIFFFRSFDLICECNRWVLHLHHSVPSLPQTISAYHFSFLNPWFLGWLSLSPQPLMTRSSLFKGRTLENVSHYHWQVSRWCHYAGLVQTTVLFRVHPCAFPVLSRGHVSPHSHPGPLAVTAQNGQQ